MTNMLLFIYSIELMYYTYLSYIIHKIIGNIQFGSLNVYPDIYLIGHLFITNECHFFISTTNKIRREIIMQIYRRKLSINFLFCILSDLLSISRLEVDTQQLIFPERII